MITHNINIWPDRQSRSGGLEASRSNGIPLARGDLSVSQERQTRPRPLTMDGQSRLRAGPRFYDTGPPEGSVTMNPSTALRVQGLRCRNPEMKFGAGEFGMTDYFGTSPPSEHDRVRDLVRTTRGSPRRVKWRLFEVDTGPPWCGPPIYSVTLNGSTELAEVLVQGLRCRDPENNFGAGKLGATGYLGNSPPSAVDVVWEAILRTGVQLWSPVIGGMLQTLKKNETSIIQNTLWST